MESAAEEAPRGSASVGGRLFSGFRKRSAPFRPPTKKPPGRRALALTERRLVGANPVGGGGLTHPGHSIVETGPFPVPGQAGATLLVELAQQGFGAVVAVGNGPCIPIPGPGPVTFHTVAAGAVEVADEALIAPMAIGNGLLKPLLGRGVVDGDARPAVFIEPGDVKVGTGVANGEGLFTPEARTLRLSYQRWAATKSRARPGPPSS